MSHPANDTKHNDAQHNDTQHNDTQHNNTQHNDTKHNDTQHNDTQHNNTQHNDTQHNDTQNKILICDTLCKSVNRTLEKFLNKNVLRMGECTTYLGKLCSHLIIT